MAEHKSFTFELQLLDNASIYNKLDSIANSLLEKNFEMVRYNELTLGEKVNFFKKDIKEGRSIAFSKNFKFYVSIAIGDDATKVAALRIQSFEPLLRIDADEEIKEDGKKVSKNWEIFIEAIKIFLDVAGENADVGYCDNDMSLMAFHEDFGFVLPIEKNDFLKTEFIWLFFLGKKRISSFNKKVWQSVPSWRKEFLKNGILIYNGPTPGESYPNPPYTRKVVAEYFQHILEAKK